MPALIVSTAHWSGDPRLNRHLRYLERHGESARLLTYEASGIQGRIKATWRALTTIWKQRPQVAIVVDPELFVPASIVGRLRRVRVVIDIHEDYRRAAASRGWIPTWLRPLVGLAAWGNDRLGRLLASSAIVAASELATPGAQVVPNIPDPSDFTVSEVFDPPARVIYIGDVTEARGALDLARLARAVPEVDVLVIGRVDPELASRMRQIAGPDASLELTGVLEHGEAWRRARGAVAGLSLLLPLPAYRNAVATKLWEYCAAGIPPVVSDLPGQRRFASQIDPDLVCGDLEEASAVIRRLAGDPGWRTSISQRSRTLAVVGWEEKRPDLALYRALAP